MNNLIHSFDTDGYYSGTSIHPIDPVAGGLARVTPGLGYVGDLPDYTPDTQRLRMVNGAIVVEEIPPPEPEQGSEQEPEPPSMCTPAQGLIALYALRGVTEQDLLATIAGIPDPVARYTAQVGLQRATTWNRDSPTMHAMAALLGLSEPDLDALFEYAVTVSV